MPSLSNVVIALANGKLQSQGWFQARRRGWEKQSGRQAGRQREMGRGSSLSNVTLS